MAVTRLSELIPPEAEFNYVLKVTFHKKDPHDFFNEANALIDRYAKVNGWHLFSTLLRKWIRYEFRYTYIAFLYVPNPTGKVWKSIYNIRKHRFRDETLDKFFTKSIAYYLRPADNDTLSEEILKNEENEKTIEDVKRIVSKPWF